jgi:hypothetical protein
LTQDFQFADEAALHVHEEKEIQARGALANKLACRRRMLHATLMISRLRPPFCRHGGVRL